MKSVLIIENDLLSIKLFDAILKEGGYHVNRAETFEQVLEQIKRGMPSAILMDLALPGTDGLTLTRRLKKDPAAKKIPVIAITAHTDLFSQDDAIKAGCDAYIVKPIDTRILLTIIEKAVSKKKPNK